MPECRAVDLIHPDWPAPANVRAFTTCRSGGVSQGRWDSFNLGDGCGDQPHRVRRNRALLRKMLPSEPRWLQQVHGTRVVSADTPTGFPVAADAAFSTLPGQVCAVLSADCLPLLMCNRAGTVVAAVHAGWRGLAAGVLTAAVAAMGCEAEELIVWLGPAIGSQAFAVGADAVAAFTDVAAGNMAAFTPQGDHWLGDLYQLARLALARLGVNHVFGGSYCTYTQEDKFFSYRRNPVTGRMVSVIWLNSGLAGSAG